MNDLRLVILAVCVGLAVLAMLMAVQTFKLLGSRKVGLDQWAADLSPTGAGFAVALWMLALAGWWHPASWLHHFLSLGVVISLFGISWGVKRASWSKLSRR